ncbi:MAG: hypothetical protein LBS25_06890 [Candidatus Symbiothrix sp.]|jgi:hypothetical protein|nr:hypothetical protein [Candidatus Symbiothrix sp.]
MKKTLFFGFMALALAFTSCGNDDDKPSGPVTVVEDGIYLVGSSVASEEITTDSRMQPGVYEGEGYAATPREDMYQHVLFISKTGNFNIVEIKGSARIKYGATTVVDSEKAWAVSGDVVQDGNAISVDEDGLYFVYLDLQAASKKIFVLKANEISVTGDGVKSGETTLTKKDAFSKIKGEWEVNDVAFQSGWWKFRMNQNWTYVIAEGIPAFTNLGGSVTDLTPGGDNLPNVAYGVYTVTLKYEYGKGFSATTTKTGEGEVVAYDQSTIFSLIGSAVKNDAGEAGNWDFDRDFTFVSNTAGHIVYEANNVALAAGQFKVRKNHLWDAKDNGGNWGYGLTVEGATLTNEDGNFALAADATFSKIRWEFDWESQVANPKLVFVP